MTTALRTITIGWTRSDPEHGYSSFSDGYRPGAEQHVETIRVEVPADWDARRIAEAVFCAIGNKPSYALDEHETRIANAIYDTGYRGQGFHYSLSVGDTVTVGETMLACASLGWGEVENFGRTGGEG